MELIYIWIDKYRTFEEQEICFSDKFTVEYKNEKLSICKNDNLVTMYPENIKGISAIVGKNASGKTSILDLIGLKIKTRFDNNEMIKISERESHTKIDLLNLKSEDNKQDYISNYFFVYYYGIDENGQDIYIFETNNPLKYITLFKNYKEYTDKPDIYYDNRLTYYEDKCWFPFVFIIKENELYLLMDTSKYKDLKEYEISIISFKQNWKKLEFYMQNDEESKVCIKRRHSLLSSKYLFQQVKFLVEQMNQNNSELYKNDKYTILISFRNDNLSDDNDLIKDYLDFSELNNLSLSEKNILAIIYLYTKYVINFLPSMTAEILELIKNCEIDTNNINIYQNYKNYYLDIIKICCENADMLYVNDRFIKVEKILGKLFCSEKNLNIAITYKKEELLIEFDKLSKISELEDFFEYFIDENEHTRNKGDTGSIFQNFISTKIYHLSDGEMANLSMYSALNEQININISTKKKYILLLDEIEQSMHPEMCRQLIFNLIKFLSQYDDKEFQIILASHSPFVISDIPKESIIYLKKENCTSIIEKPTKNTLGANIHTLIKDSFFMDSTIGAFAEQNIKTILKVISRNKETQKYYNINKVTEMINKDLKINLDDRDISKFISKFIDSIGEDIIRNHLKNKFNDWHNCNKSNDEKVSYYKYQIKELEDKINKIEGDNDKN